MQQVQHQVAQRKQREYRQRPIIDARFMRHFVGYFGVDCALSYDDSGTKMEVLAGQDYKPNKRGPSIYVYEIPPEFHVK